MNRRFIFNRVYIISVLLFFPFVSQGFAQESTRQEGEFQPSWDIKNLQPSITFSQIYLDNWQKGGNEAFTFTLILDNDFTRNGRWAKWDTSIDLKLGQTKLGKSGGQIIANQIKIRSDLVYKQRKYVNPFFGGTLETQVTSGFEYPEDEPRDKISDFWDPFILTYRVGFDFSLLKDLTFRISGDFIERRGNRFLEVDDVFVKRNASRKISSYLKYDKSFRNDSVSIKSELDAKTDLQKYMNSYVDWENKILFKLVKFVDVSIISNFLYVSKNEDSKKGSIRGQFRQITGITLSYDFRELIRETK